MYFSQDRRSTQSAADNEHVFVVRAIEDDELAACRRLLMDSPQKIVGELDRRRDFERGDPTTGGVHFAKNRTNRSVLPACVQSLKDDQDGMRLRGIKQFLQFNKLSGQLRELGLALLALETAILFRLDFR